MSAWSNKYKINFSFTNFPSFYSHWRLANGGKEVSNGTIIDSRAPHSVRAPICVLASPSSLHGKIIYSVGKREKTIWMKLYWTAEPSYNEALAARCGDGENILSGFGKDYQECSLVGKRSCHTKIHKTRNLNYPAARKVARFFASF